MLHISEVKCAFWEAPLPCCFHEERKSHEKEFHTRTKACAVIPIYLCPLEPCWYHCVWISSVSSLLSHKLTLTKQISKFWTLYNFIWKNFSMISVILWYNKNYGLVFQTLVISWVVGVSGGCSIMHLKPLSTISDCMLMRRVLVGA